jgi:hypothetical protein
LQLSFERFVFGKDASRHAPRFFDEFTIEASSGDYSGRSDIQDMIDIALAAFLLIGIPVLVVWRERSGIRRFRIARYRSAILMISGCLSVLAIQ